MVGILNELSEEVVGTGTNRTFKRLLDWYMDKKGLEGYEPNTGRWEELDGHLDQHGKIGLKGLLQFCMTLSLHFPNPFSLMSIVFMAQLLHKVEIINCKCSLSEDTIHKAKC